MKKTYPSHTYQIITLIMKVINTREKVTGGHNGRNVMKEGKLVLRARNYFNRSKERNERDLQELHTRRGFPDSHSQGEQQLKQRSTEIKHFSGNA